MVGERGIEIEGYRGVKGGGGGGLLRNKEMLNAFCFLIIFF